jgi:biopolymer transport protein ExbB
MRLTFAHAVRRAAPVIFLSLILPVAALSQEAAEIATEVATEVAAETVVEEARRATEDAQTEEEGGFWSLLFNKGGVVTWIIAMLSAIGLPIAAVKFVQFLRMEIWRPKHVEAAMMRYRAGDVRGLSGDLEDIAHPAAPLIAFAIAEAHRGGSKGEAGELLREEASRRAQYLLRHLGSNIWVLELIAASAPLFGLLGTVLGMIVAFQGVGQGVGGADTALLAAGIWEALLTTAFGLAVALPFSILAAIFNNAVDNTRDLLEDALTEIMVRSATGASAKG